MHAAESERVNPRLRKRCVYGIVNHKQNNEKAAKGTDWVGAAIYAPGGHTESAAIAESSVAVSAQ